MHSHDYTATTRLLPRQARRRARDGQLGDGHRGRGELRRRRNVPGRAPRRVHDPQVPVRPAARPVRGVGAASPFEVRREALPGDARGPSAVGRHGALRAARSPTTGSARRTRRSPTTSSSASPTARSRPSRTSPRSTATRVRFADGSEVEADIVVYCTGYKVTFPFFDEGFISAPDNDLPLFRRVFHPDVDNVVLHRAAAAARGDHAARRGAVANGSATTCAAATRCPRRAEMRADMRARSASGCSSRYVASKRHTMQVDFDDYLCELGRERKARRGAGARGRASRCPSRRARGARRPSLAAVRRDGRTPSAGARRPRRPTAPRSSTRRARCSPSSATARPACATSIRRTDLASGTFYNYFPDKESVFRALVEQSAARGAPARARGPRRRAQRSSSSSSDAYRAYFAFIVEDPADVRAHAAQRGHDPRAVRRPRPRAGSTSWPRTCAPRSARGELPDARRRLRARARWSASALELGDADGRARAARRRGRRRASRPSCSSAGSRA